LLGALAEAGFHAVAPFMRGYAPSTVEAGTYESAALAADALDLAESLAGPTPVRLVGHDWGGVAALHAAAWRPERVARLVTLAMPHAAALARAIRGDYEQQRRFWYQFLFLVDGLAERLVSADGFAFVDRLVADWSPGPSLAPEEWEAVKRTLAAPGVLSAALGYYRAAYRPALRNPALAEVAARWADPVAAPTLAVAGAEDGCIGRAVHEAQTDGFRGPFRLEIVAGAGHWPHREAPDAVTPLVLEWLGDGA
jgi:pimeloyl-ACP methyl ester carboxylesterase